MAEGPRPAMELYLSACSKAANVAATKTATSSLAADSQKCGDVSGSPPGVAALWGPGKESRRPVARFLTARFWRPRAGGGWHGSRSALAVPGCGPVPKRVTREAGGGLQGGLGGREPSTLTV